MPPKTTPPKPRAGQHRRPTYRGRIEGLGSPAPTSLRATTPTLVRATTPLVSRQFGRKAMKCSNPTCSNPSVIESDQGLICETCGAVAQEESGLVSEQGFGETDSGRITALGVHLGESQTHQRTYAPGGALGNAGREPTINRDRSEAQARTIMNSFQTLLNIRSAEVEAGMQIFKLAWGNSFVQGRTIDSVAVVCLYLACRRKREQYGDKKRPVYSLMLIDFAENLNMDVFALGKMYGELVRRLYLQPDGTMPSEIAMDLLAVGPEYLVNRFVDELEFDRAHRDKIKLDAVRIVQRMKRDWLDDGRRPSGVCGAAVILAARMNNYRRTTREVVLTAKVTEITIQKRLEEFHDTASSKLSVSQFRDDQVLAAIEEELPPAFVRGLQPPKEKKKRGRPRKHPLPEVSVVPGADTSGSEPPGDDGGAVEPPAKRARVDADGYKIPDIPQRDRQPLLDPSLTPATQSPTSSTQSKAPPGRPAGAKNWKAPAATPAELAIENEIEQGLLDALRDNPQVDPRYDPENALPTPASTQESEVDALATLPPPPNPKVRGPAVDGSIGNLGNVSLSPTLRPEEFDSDEDVSSCLLSEEESRMKERVWVSMNADWLRQDHAKRIRRELKEADMRARGLDPAKEALKLAQARGKRKDGTKKPGRRGDVSYLHDRENGGDDDAADGRDGSVREERELSAAGSVRQMLKTRGVYSRRVNYDVLESIYDPLSAESRSATSRSQSVVSEAQSDREGSVASVATASATTRPTVSEGIFRGNGPKGSGKARSRASLAAEKREVKRREQQKMSSAEAGEWASEGANTTNATTDDGSREQETGGASLVAQQQQQQQQSPPTSAESPPVTSAHSTNPSIAASIFSGIPTIRSSAPSATASKAQSRANKTLPPKTRGRNAQQSAPRDKGDSQSKEVGAGDEDEAGNEDGGQSPESTSSEQGEGGDEDEADEDVEAAFQGRYRGRNLRG